ncbi:GH1 family beta-glucosidase [Chengkuizengella sediminis]|uniref:GH1 family beta-glucosidase n=1 Tax=Chengkuizengella sediminis TaxID=1885917 RepID=UPI001389E095|nr:GH1 family beta-glucosidase [Chengkuizengella sediminis]NDI35206.1 beta-glucosidase [Chengkuizengella sediminis]
MTILQFPKDFKWGTATAAYQIEGAYDKDGRGMSIWDTFSRIPGKVFEGDNGDVACDSYHRYEEDIQLMKQLGITVYRFSVSWPRIFPNGTGEINQKGLAYYHNFVDKLLENGIEPYCTLYHWDLPQALQDQGGWENRESIDAFVNYAETMFKEFAGKIKSWMTFNEMWCSAFLSNYYGNHAPGKKNIQTAVDVAHHLLVAHGKTVSKYRELGVEGQIGYAPNVTWNEPFSNKQEDIDTANRGRAWYVEWFMDPVFKGSYPQFMVDWFEQKGVKMNVQPGDMEAIHQPIDFLGINYYTGGVVKFKEDSDILDNEGINVGRDKTDIGWDIYPEGLYYVLKFITDRYGQIPIYITENGACYNDEPKDGIVNDEGRTSFLKKHILQLHRSIESGVNVKGYMCWSMMDNFEWAYGYSMRFGLVHVNYRTQERTPKESYYWYQKLVKNNYLKV